ncbi:MAG: peptide chain release factor N(5)-glutamine methyltransferase [Actinomycetota bacterium]|nr:peptide chain release factor N(5)-glutamine methyltransferase [Actinomycetota bacterium]
MPTANEILDEAERILKASDLIDHPHTGKERFDGEEILEFVMGRVPRRREEIPSPALRRFRRLIQRRASGEPVAYITGSAKFRQLTLEVRRGGFIPRESTEFMALQAIRRLRPRRRPVHVDLATGVGPVALAVADALRRARVFGVDISGPALSVARRNATRLKLRNATFLRGDLFAPLPKSIMGSVDVVTIHPPYVARGEVKDLPDEIRRFEPRESITDFSRTGLGLLERTTSEAPRWLRDDGWLLVEVSPDRARSVASLLRRSGFREVRSTIGPVKFTRVLVGKAPA